MGKQKSIAELKNLQRMFTEQLEAMDPADKRYRNIQSKLKAVEQQLMFIQTETDGVAHTA